MDDIPRRKGTCPLFRPAPTPQGRSVTVPPTHPPDRDAGESASSGGLAELSRRPLSADRRLLGAMVAAALGLAFAYAWLFHFRKGAVQAGPSLLQYALITAYVLLLVAVVFYLLRYLIRLLSERRAGILGSRFKFKLVATFIAKRSF